MKKNIYLKYIGFIFLNNVILLYSMEHVGVFPFNEGITAAELEQRISDQWQYDIEKKNKEISDLKHCLEFQKEISKAISYPIYLSDLIKAAQNLPDSYTESHLCIQLLETALKNFKEQTKKPSEIITESKKALEGTRFLIKNLFHKIELQKTLLTGCETKYKILQEECLQSDKITNNAKQALSKNQIDLQDALKIIAILGQQKQAIQNDFDKIRDNHYDEMTSMRIQRNIFIGAFLVCALSFLRYIMHHR